MTETTGGRDRRTTDPNPESTWGATEAAKQTWVDQHATAAREAAVQANEEAGTTGAIAAAGDEPSGKQAGKSNT